MVMQDAVTAWDIKPSREDTNKKFNMLCNVIPIEHPRTWDWYNKQSDIIHWSRDQFWFEKCKWLRRCKLYEYKCSSDKYVPEEDMQSKKRKQNRRWNEHSNFTDVVTFQWYRIYMRRVRSVLNPYAKYSEVNENWKQIIDSWWDNNPNTCDSDMPSNVIRETRVDKENTTDDMAQMSDATRIYIQKVDIENCWQDTYDSADESPIMLVKEYSSAECNPDHFVIWYWGIGTPQFLWKKAKIDMFYYWWNLFAYIYDLDAVPTYTNNVFVSDLWIYLTLVKPDRLTTNIINAANVQQWWYFISEVAELSTMCKLPDASDMDNSTVKATTELSNWVYAYKDFWEVPYFAAGSKLYSINWFFNRNDNDCDIPTDEELNDVIWKDFKPWDWCTSRTIDDENKKIFIADQDILTAYNDWVITWLSRRWGRLTYISNWFIYISWNGRLNWTFSPYFYSQSWDAVRWAFRLPSWVTDVREYNSSLIVMWAKKIYWIVNEDQLKTWVFVSSWENDDWCYCPWSYFNDEWEMLIIRRWKVLESMQLAVSYWTWSIAFEPSTWFYINWHIKACNNRTDKIHIDATINHRYISIYNDDDTWDNYSKLLIYDKHYNCWVHWLINWARVVHVKDNIFLWDNVYVNKWRTRNWEDDDTKWKEIIENISLYVWEEWLQTPKHIQYIKTAIWNHSVITSNSKRYIWLSYWWKLFERINDITTTRYPKLLFKKDEDWVIETYINWEKIYWYWKQVSYNLVSEITNYRGFEKIEKPILREMWEDIDYDSKLALFASIKEPVNSPANVISVSISARWLDNIQVWSFYIWYYQLDADYEDIENTHIDMSEFADRTKTLDIDSINKWEYCEEILQWSACDNTLLNSN